MTGRVLLRLHVPAAALAALIALLAMRAGGFHARTFGWACLALTVWACFQAARGRLSSLRSPAGIATAAVVLLTLWTTLSITWVDVSRHSAWEEAVRTLMYAAAFVLGGSLLASARTFVRFATWVGIGTAVVGVLAAMRMAWGPNPLKLFVGGRLDQPIGYANGVAALYILGALLLLGVACTVARNAVRDNESLTLPSVLSGLCLGGASLLAMLAMLAQSRGSVPALLIGLVIALIAAPERSAWLSRLAVIGVTLLAVRAPLGDVFQRHFELVQAPFTKGASVNASLDASLDAVRHAGVVMLVAAVAVTVVGALLVPLSVRIGEAIGEVGVGRARRAIVPASIASGALVVTLVVMAGNGSHSPIGWTRAQIDACAHPPSVMIADPGSARSHFANTGTGRCDYYRVALLGFRQDPLTGIGAANFHGLYVRERRTGEEPRVAHSLPLQLLGELGIVGAALGATVLGCVLWAGWRFLRSGPARDPAFAGALGAIAYWLAHSSVDWLWQLPATTLPAVILMGGLVACISPPQGKVPPTAAAPLAAGILLAAIALVLPLTMADRALRQARDPELRERDPKAALAAARDAASFDPTWAEPQLAQGGLLYAAGKRREAGQAGRRAIELEPRDWSVLHRASGLVGLIDGAAGRAAFEEALRFNPRLAAEHAAKERLAASKRRVAPKQPTADTSHAPR